MTSRAVGAPRLPFVDALRAAAAQLIVLHHLAFYGPLSDAAEPLAPTLIAWLSQHARLAVQLFLVIGGFLAARQLAPSGTPQVARPLALVARRYGRLATPYLLALVLAIAGAAVARLWMDHDSIPAPPTVPQLLAHALLLQNLLDYDALTAGAWYVAIDFQLFAVAVFALWACQRLGRGIAATRRLTLLTFAGGALVSLLYFNLDARWDVWAIYFVGAYALGALAWWLSAADYRPRWLVALAAAGLVIALLNGRPHTAVAVTSALVLALARRSGLLAQWPTTAFVEYLGRISYSVFLVHFPVCLLVNGAFQMLAPDDPLYGALGMLTALLASNAVGAWFHAHCERPLVNRFSSAHHRAASGPDRRGMPVAHHG